MLKRVRIFFAARIQAGEIFFDDELQVYIFSNFLFRAEANQVRHGPVVRHRAGDANGQGVVAVIRFDVRRVHGFERVAELRLRAKEGDFLDAPAFADGGDFAAGQAQTNDVAFDSKFHKTLSVVSCRLRQ